MKNTIYNVNSDNSCTMNISTQSMKRTELRSLSLSKGRSKGHSKGRKLLTLNSSLLTVLFCLLVGGKVWGQSTLTVADGTTTNSYVPIYGTYCDANQKNQIIYPASMFDDMGGNATISGLTFYFSSTPDASKWNENFTILIGETSSTSFGSLAYVASPSTTVFSGTITSCINTSTKVLTISFSSSYTYNGGNLIIEIQHTKGTYSGASFNGITSTGGSVYGYNSSSMPTSPNSSVQNFIPKTTFTYTKNCTPRPDSLYFTTTECEMLAGGSFTNTSIVNHSGTAVFSVSPANAGVTVNSSTGEVTAEAGTDGTFTIKATIPAHNGYCSKSASYTLNVSDVCTKIGIGANMSSSGTSGGIYTYMNYYAYTQQLYTASELGATAGVVESISLHYGETSTNSLTFEIYLGQTSQASVPTSWITDANLTKVYGPTSTTFTSANNGWKSIDISSANWEWDGTSNILVAIRRTDKTAPSGTMYPNFYHTNSTSPYMMAYVRNPSSSIVLGSNNVATTNGSQDVQRPEIKFCITPACEKLSAPTFSVTPGLNKNTLSWSNITNNQGYKVQYATDSSFTTGVGTADIAQNATSWVHNGSGGSTYYYRMLTKGDGSTYCAEGDYSGEQHAQMLSCTSLSAPTNVSASAIYQGASLTWNAVANASSYTVYWGTTDACTGGSQSGITGTSYEVTGLTPGTPYYFKVMAVGSGTYCTENSKSSAVSATPVSRTVTVSTETINCVGAGSTTLRATVSPAASGLYYTWSASPSEGAGLPQNHTDLTTNTITVTPTAAGNYTYTCVVSESAGGGSGASYSIGDVVWITSDGNEIFEGTGNSQPTDAENAGADYACKVAKIDGGYMYLYGLGHKNIGYETSLTTAGSRGMLMEGYENTTSLNGIAATSTFITTALDRDPNSSTYKDAIEAWVVNEAGSDVDDLDDEGWFIPSISEMLEVRNNLGEDDFFYWERGGNRDVALSSSYIPGSSFFVYGIDYNCEGNDHDHKVKYQVPVAEDDAHPASDYSICDDDLGASFFPLAIRVPVVGSGTSASLAITVGQAPSITTPSAVSVCVGEEVTLTPSISNVSSCETQSYSWSTGATSLNITPSTSSAGNTTYTFTVTNVPYKIYDYIEIGEKKGIVVTAPTATTAGQAVALNDDIEALCSGSAMSITDNYIKEALVVNGGTETSSRKGFTIPNDASGGVCASTMEFPVTVNALPTPTISGTTTICNGASTTLTAGGGTQYNWGSGFSATATHTVSPSSTTAYTVTVKDGNGCSAEKSQMVTVNALPTPTISQTNNYTELTCSRTSITLTANGSGGTFAWSGGGTGTTNTVSSAGPYTVTETKNGCSGTSDEYEITSNTEHPTVSITGTNEICLGVSTTLQTTSNANYTYLWSNSVETYNNTVSPNTTTTYSVTTTDSRNNCSAIASRTVTVNTPDIPNASSYDYIWRGATSTNWNVASNWYVYNSGYSVASSMPGDAKDYYIGTGDCISGSNSPSLNADATVKNLTIYGRSLSIPENKTLNIKGNVSITNNGTISAHNNSTVVFCGTSAQTVDGELAFGKLTFNNARGVTLNNDVTVNSLATFTSGIVNGNMTFETSASSADASYTSHVNGTVTKKGNGSSFIFPTGNDNVLGSIQASVETGKTVSVQFRHNSAGFSESEMPRWWNSNDNCEDNETRFDHVSNFEFWKVNTTSALSATITVSAETATEHFNSEATTYNIEDIFAAMWQGCWNNVGGGTGSVSVTHDTIIVNGIEIPAVSTRASEPQWLTLGSKSHSTLLPIELLSFTATCDGRSSLIEWTTATEKNNDYFSLERSDDAINFTEIARIAGAGNSIELLSYSYTDYGVRGGDNYYRLVQVDYDGTRTVSEIVVANCIEPEVGEPDVQAYPNPFNDELTVVLDNFGNRAATIEVYDMLGKLIYTNKVAAPQNSYETILNLSNLPPAAYTVRVSTNDFVINRNVVKQ